jgi:hypothetical protein
MQKPVCNDCRFWEAVEQTRGHGICRRYAPRPRVGNVETDADIGSNWPLTRGAADWCGEFERRPEPAA